MIDTVHNRCAMDVNGIGRVKGGRHGGERKESEVEKSRLGREVKEKGEEEIDAKERKQ